VGDLQASELCGTKAPQEAPESVAVGKVGKPEQRRDQPVVDECLGVLDASHAGHDGEQVSQQQIGGMVRPVRVRGPADVKLEEPPQAQRFAK